MNRVAATTGSVRTVRVTALAVVAMAIAAAGAGVWVHRSTATQPRLSVAGESALVAVPANTTESSRMATTTTTSTTTTTTTVTPAPAPAPNSPAALGHDTARVTAFGDSVLLEAQDELAAGVAEFSIEAAIGRQVGETIEAVHAVHDSGGLTDEIVVQIGNNGPVTSHEFDEILSLLTGARMVVVVNVKVPRHWEAANNEVVAEGVSRWPNAVLVDWHSAGSDNPDVLHEDGVHLRWSGARLLAEMILSAL